MTIVIQDGSATYYNVTIQTDRSVTVLIYSEQGVGRFIQMMAALTEVTLVNMSQSDALIGTLRAMGI